MDAPSRPFPSLDPPPPPILSLPPPSTSCSSSPPQAAIYGKVKGVLALDRDDPTKEDSVKALRTDINQWVAKYRREPKVSGRPSFG